MTAAENAHYLKAVKDAMKGIEGWEPAVEALEDAIKVFTKDGNSGWRYRLAFCPPDDMMPLEAANEVTRISDSVDRFQSNWVKEMDDDTKEDETAVFSMEVTWGTLQTMQLAMTVYKSLLMQVNAEEIRKQMEMAMEKEREEEVENAQHGAD